MRRFFCLVQNPRINRRWLRLCALLARVDQQWRVLMQSINVGIHQENEE